DDGDGYRGNHEHHRDGPRQVVRGRGTRAIISNRCAVNWISVLVHFISPDNPGPFTVDVETRNGAGSQGLPGQIHAQKPCHALPRRLSAVDLPARTTPGAAASLDRAMLHY